MVAVSERMILPLLATMLLGASQRDKAGIGARRRAAVGQRRRIADVCTVERQGVGIGHGLTVQVEHRAGGDTGRTNIGAECRRAADLQRADGNDGAAGVGIGAAEGEDAEVGFSQPAGGVQGAGRDGWGRGRRDKASSAELPVLKVTATLWPLV